MEEEKIVDFETAKALNELGFPLDYENAIYVVRDCESEDGDYWTKHKIGELIYSPSGFYTNDWISAPTLELVKLWFINNYKYYIEITPSFLMKENIINFNKWFYKIHSIKTITYDEFTNLLKEKNSANYFDSYEEALESGIKDLIQKIKSEK